jgi:Fe2+ or Zn2+ uptake regulation protein
MNLRILPWGMRRFFLLLVPRGETLAELGRHVSADELLAAVGERLPNVSLPTVYSALDALGEAGLVRRVPAGRGRAREARFVSCD